MAEGLTRSSLRTPPRALGTESGRMYREARKLERKGYSGAAQQVAAAAAQQKLTNERPGFLSADTAIEEQKLQLEAAKKKAAIASGMVPQETRRGLFEDIRAAAGQGLTGAEGAKQLAGFRSRATQLGVTPEAFDRTVGGRLGVALPATTPAVTPTPTATTAATTTPPVVAPASPKPERATGVLRSMRAVAGTPTRGEATGATGSMAEFLRGVQALTAPEGGDLTRGAAVDELNKQRMAEGKAPLDREAALQGLLEQDRAASQQRAEPARIFRRNQLESDIAREDMARFLGKQKSLLPTASVGASTPTTTTPAATSPTPTPAAAVSAAPMATPPAPMTMTTPEAMMDRVRKQGQAATSERAARVVRAREEQEARIAQRIRELERPDFLKNTTAGDIWQKFREYSIRASGGR